jgi:guanine deaminase
MLRIFSTTPNMNIIKKALRADTLLFREGQAFIERDALVLIDEHSKITAVGPYLEVISQQSPEQQSHIRSIVQYFPKKLLAPGFVDCHVHYPQLDVIGSPAEGLLPWLENYTFPHEARFADFDYASSVAGFFFDELARNGVTTAMTFSTSHKASVDAAFAEAERRQLRFITGKCLMDRHCPEGVQDTTEQSLIDTETLIGGWHEKANTRLGYAITPRFAPGCSDAQMHGAAALAKQYPSTWIQSHVAENDDEIAWAKSLYPASRSYLNVYADFGLMRQRAIYAHCIHLDEQDRQLLSNTQTAAAVCPTSNLFLGSGAFDFEKAKIHNHLFGLASDVGGGTSFSPFKTMLAAFYIAQSRHHSLTPSALWHSHTVGAAQALGLEGCVGNIAQGMEADIIILDPHSTPLLSRRVQAANSIEELLFAMIVLGDDRVIASHLLD